MFAPILKWYIATSSILYILESTFMWWSCNYNAPASRTGITSMRHSVAQNVAYHVHLFLTVVTCSTLCRNSSWTRGVAAAANHLFPSLLPSHRDCGTSCRQSQEQGRRTHQTCRTTACNTRPRNALYASLQSLSQHCIDICVLRHPRGLRIDPRSRP
jgi:hypothetical protein